MILKHKDGHPIVAELLDFKTKVKAIADDPKEKDSLKAIIATRCAIDIDHLARIISSPSIQVRTWTLVAKAKRRLTRPQKCGK